MKKHFGIRKPHLILLWLSLCVVVGCGKSSQSPPAQQQEQSEKDYSNVSWQTDSVSFLQSTTTMEDNNFYVEHKNEDGSVVYYRLGTPTMSDANAYYSSGYEDVPTLFLGQGDRLLFHSFGNLLQNIYFSRLQDLGYTVGIYDIATMENGRCYLPTGTDHVLPLCTDADFLNEKEAENILIDEMGKTLPSEYIPASPTPNKKTYSYWNEKLYYYDGYRLVKTISTKEYTVDDVEHPTAQNVHYPKLNADNVQRGVLYGLEQDTLYHLEFYTGTYYKKADLRANIHIFSQKEYFHTNQYDVLQSTLFEVELPKMKNGVYLVGLTLGNGKAFRLINEDSYDFADVFDEYVLPVGLYGLKSDIPAYNDLNLFEGIEDCTYVTDTSKYETGKVQFQYTSANNTFRGDNGISWFYQKDGVQVGRILERHKDYLLPDDLLEYALYTLTEIDDGQYIKRCFLPLEKKEPILEEIVFEESTDTVNNSFFPDLSFSQETIPLSTMKIYTETFSSCDFVFLHEDGLQLEPKKGIMGIIVLNGVKEGESNVSILSTYDSNE